MKVVLRIVKDFSLQERAALQKIGIVVHSGWDAFVIDADSPVAADIQCILEDLDTTTQIQASFSENDRTDAPFLNILANKILGYAKLDGTEEEVDDFSYPFDIYPYYKGVFEVDDTDEDYGLLRGEQIGSYSLSGEPKWGTKRIASAHCVEDAFFVPPEIYEKIFQPLNIGCLPVLKYKTAKPLQNVVQIVQQGISPSKLQIGECQTAEIIDVPKWGLRKYRLREDIYYPSFITRPHDLDFFYTQEHFGPGGHTQRDTVISQKLYRILKTEGIKGLNYFPMKSDRSVEYNGII